MFMIDPMSRVPVYEQLTVQVERFILNGLLSPGDQLPSVRSLSIELGVNPNTIQKAYSELDTQGILSSVPGRGCFVSAEAKELLGLKGKKRLPQLRALASELILSGVSPEEMHREIDDAAKDAAAERRVNSDG